MNLKGLKVALCVSGTFCQLENVINTANKLVDLGVEIIPIFSEKVLNNYKHDEEWVKQIEYLMSLTDKVDYKKPLFIQIEKLTKNVNLDLCVVISTGNTLSKISNAISDDNIPFLVKGMQRNNRPIIMAISTNDALGLNLANIGKLLNTKNFYFVPFRQDNPVLKPHSLSFNYDLIGETIDEALNNKQIQPILL